MSVSVLDSQFSLSGLVLWQLRVRYWIPPPQECVQVENSVQLPHVQLSASKQKINEPLHGKTNDLGFRPSPTQNSLYNNRSRLEARNFGLKKKSYCTVCVAKTKTLISFAVTAKLVCAFVIAFAICWFCWFVGIV